MQENHSYDNYLGMLGRGDGLTLEPGGLPTNTRTSWNGGAMDGFVQAAGAGHYDHVAPPAAVAPDAIAPRITVPPYQPGVVGPGGRGPGVRGLTIRSRPAGARAT